MCLFYYCNFALGDCKLYKGITNYIYNKYWGVQIPGSTYYMLHRLLEIQNRTYYTVWHSPELSVTSTAKDGCSISNRIKHTDKQRCCIMLLYSICSCMLPTGVNHYQALTTPEQHNNSTIIHFNKTASIHCSTHSLTSFTYISVTSSQLWWHLKYFNETMTIISEICL